MSSLTCAALLFDLDGVLIDSNPVYEAQWAEWAQERRVALEKILAVHHGRPVEETIAAVAPHLNAAQEAQAYKEALERSNRLTEVRPFPSAREMLWTLPRDRWAIATSAPLEFALTLIEHGSLPMPQTLVSGDDVGMGKPYPYPYLRAAWGLGKDVKECIVVEDAPAGIAAAHAAGARVIALRTTTTTKHLTAADHIVDELADLAVHVMSDGLAITLAGV